MGSPAYNLVIVTASGLRSDHLGCHGNRTIRTAHIDRLAKEGVRFENCYSTSPGHAASRISFVTSTYPGEHQHRGEGARVSPRVPNLAAVLRGAGYWTGLFGHHPCFTDEAFEGLFDEADAVELGSFEGHPDVLYAHSAFPLHPAHEFNQTEQLTGELCGFVRRNKERPFFGWLGLREPAPPYTCPPPYDTLFPYDEVALPAGWPHPKMKYEPRRCEVWRVHSDIRECDDEGMQKAIATYMGMVRYVDDMLGQVLATLADSGVLDRTVVLFHSDIGDLLGYRGMVHHLPVFYDCLTRVPAIIRHPEGRWARQVFRGLSEQVDLVPTVLETLGLEIPPTMLGQSWVMDLDLEQDPGKETVISEGGIGAATEQAPSTTMKFHRPEGVTFHGPAAMIRKEAFKLSIYFDDVCELFDLDLDPQELNNLFEDPGFIDVREELTHDLLRRMMGIKVRPFRGEWPRDAYPVDVRQSPLEDPAVSAARPIYPPLQGHGRLQTTRRYLSPDPPPKVRKTPRSSGATRVPFAPAAKPGGVSRKKINQVLFICTHNYYRGRFAEAFFNYYADILNIRYSCFSRGIDIEGGGEGSISPIAVDAMDERDINPKYAATDRRPLTGDDLARADRIIAMDEEEHRPLLKHRFPEYVDKIEFWNARAADKESPEESLQTIERGVTELIKQLDSQG